MQTLKTINQKDQHYKLQVIAPTQELTVQTATVLIKADIHNSEYWNLKHLFWFQHITYSPCLTHLTKPKHLIDKRQNWKHFSHLKWIITLHVVDVLHTLSTS